ncbi:hypothetical protein V1514DRAFT_335522 [Lipomyces japonicus]|uniref:uncharacterized protein n=1 Tax=Lipomyces japonicus TaxID=56871 RepID=UPI0034CE2603
MEVLTERVYSRDVDVEECNDIDSIILQAILSTEQQINHRHHDDPLLSLEILQHEQAEISDSADYIDQDVDIDIDIDMEMDMDMVDFDMVAAVLDAESQSIENVDDSDVDIDIDIANFMLSLPDLNGQTDPITTSPDITTAFTSGSDPSLMQPTIRVDTTMPDLVDSTDADIPANTDALAHARSLVSSMINKQFKVENAPPQSETLTSADFYPTPAACEFEMHNTSSHVIDTTDAAALISEQPKPASIPVQNVSPTLDNVPSTPVSPANDDTQPEIEPVTIDPSHYPAWHCTESDINPADLPPAFTLTIKLSVPNCGITVVGDDVDEFITSTVFRRNEFIPTRPTELARNQSANYCYRFNNVIF